MVIGLRLLDDWGGGGGGEGEQIPYKSRYRCEASAESRLHKISPKTLIPSQKSASKPNDQSSFDEI